MHLVTDIGLKHIYSTKREHIDKHDNGICKDLCNDGYSCMDMLCDVHTHTHEYTA